MTDKQDRLLLPNNIILKDRSELSVSGVTDMDSFDENTVIAYTDLGELTITGSEIHIEKLNIDTGELIITGRISSLTYLDQAPKSTSFFSKVFR